MFKKMSLFAAVMAIAIMAIAAPVLAMTPINTVFSEDWSMDAQGDLISESYQWTGDNTTFVVGAGEVGNLVANEGNDWVWTQADFGAQMDGQTWQLFHFDVTGENTSGSDTNRMNIYVLDENGNQWLRWFGDGGRLIPRLGGNVGTAAQTINDGWHDFDILYNSTTGSAQWFNDGSLVYSLTTGVGKYMSRVEINNGYGQLGNTITLDNIMVGTVPEPSGLLALGGLGLTALGMIKRRRA